jgi:hypothetical protein
MNVRAPYGVELLALVALVLVLTDCRKDPPPPPTPKVINLRVVMFVETGADLDNPPLDTGGCKLTRTEVTTLVQELIAFAPKFCPGLRIAWSGSITKLESDCLHLLPALFQTCSSQCGDLPFPGTCPRAMGLI